jgi:hypothetical protein
MTEGRDVSLSIVYKKNEILALLKYLNKYPLRSAKKNRVLFPPSPGESILFSTELGWTNWRRGRWTSGIAEYFLLKNLKAHLALPNSILGKDWTLF